MERTGSGGFCIIDLSPRGRKGEKMKKNELITAVESMKEGETIYINAIGMTVKQIDILRRYIKLEILSPDPEELSKMIKAEYHYEFYSGEKIAPQMIYVKMA